MIRTPVKSSNIRSVGYDGGSRTMQVEFAGGKVYEYPDVDPETHAAFVGAESIGGHFSREIRPKFAGRQLDEPADPGKEVGKPETTSRT